MLERRTARRTIEPLVALGVATFVVSMTSCELSTSAAQTSPQPSLSASSHRATSPAPDNPAPHVSANTVNLTPSARPATLKLASWNLEWLAAKELHGPVQRRAADYARLARQAKLLNADIIAVQEVENVQALARVFDMARYKAHVTHDSTSQKTGFVYAKHLNVEILPDYTALAAGGLRSGADIAVRFPHLSVRLLSVHLKSGCFDRPLNRDKACSALGAQIPKLEGWIDAQASAQTPFAVVGDFNRRLFGRLRDEVWSALDDADPPESDLDSPTRGQRSTCWDARHPQYVDHLVLSRSLTARAIAGSFEQLSYNTSDAPRRKKLSDHCPIAITLSVSAEGAVTQRSTRQSTATNSGFAREPIKGNIARDGRRLYHTVDCPNYTRVKIETAKGERLFSSEEAAQRAGFELAPGCRK